MPTHLITLAFDASRGSFARDDVDALLADASVSSVRDHFFIHEGVPYLALIVTTAGESARRPTPPRPVADEPADDELRTRLRAWRAAEAKERGVPRYVVLTNRQLDEVVWRKPQTGASLTAIPGIGKKTSERYGDALLDLVRGKDTGPVVESQQLELEETSA